MSRLPRRVWVMAGIAVLLFLGSLAGNVVTNNMEAVTTGWLRVLWLVVFLAGIATVAIAVREARREASTPGIYHVANAMDELRLTYLGQVAKRLQYLPLAPVDLKSASAETDERERLRLTDVYVDLDTTAQRDRELHRGTGGLERQEPVSALQALVETRRLVLTGEPGGGKSTFLNYVTYCLAADGLDPRQHWLGHLQPWPEEWSRLLPIPLALRDVAAWFQATQCHHRKSGLFFAYLRDWLTQLGTEEFYEPLCDRLRDGAALLLLDGLDEVPVQDDVLYRIKEMIEDLPATLDQTPTLVTCRVLSYADSRWRLTGDEWPVFQLAPLSQEKIDGFIDAWYNHLATVNVVSQPGPPSAKLKHAVRREDLRRLAPNPLLLTVMALVHTYRSELPDARAQLYEDVVDLLLLRWESTKARHSDETTTDMRQLLQQVGQREMDLKQILWELAYNAHAQVRDASEQDATADIPKLALLSALRTLHPDPHADLNWAEAVITVMQSRAGLLVERTPDVFTFPHRTFQEYLAGCHLSTLPGFTDRALELTREGAFWREVILLAVGRLNHLSGDTGRPLELVSELCGDALPGADDVTGWRNVWLAGNCLLELGLATARRRALGSELTDRVQAQLVHLVTTDRLQPRERAAAGSTLAVIGDPRDLDAWVAVPAGPFVMGSGAEDALKSGDEEPRHTVTLSAFAIGKYPVTNGQYARFVEATGHRSPDLWQSNAPPPELRNHPVVTVSWHDARAYCDWLSKERGEEIRLPTEAEWEKAARGGDGRVWPWGNEYDGTFCNGADAGVQGTSPVGIFQAGASPYGVLDMVGNVWEWTGSLWGVDVVKPDYGYPYDPHDGREDPAAPDGVLRTLRGGAWGGSGRRVRCAPRIRNGPDIRSLDVGFRVVCVPRQLDSGRSDL